MDKQVKSFNTACEVLGIDPKIYANLLLLHNFEECYDHCGEVRKDKRQLSLLAFKLGAKKTKSDWIKLAIEWNDEILAEKLIRIGARPKNVLGWRNSSSAMLEVIRNTEREYSEDTDFG